MIFPIISFIFIIPPIICNCDSYINYLIQAERIISSYESMQSSYEDSYFEMMGKNGLYVLEYRINQKDKNCFIPIVPQKKRNILERINNMKTIIKTFRWEYLTFSRVYYNDTYVSSTVTENHIFIEERNLWRVIFKHSL